MPDKNVVATILTSDSPPRTRSTPTITLASATSRPAIPPSAMIAPASTKKGIVSMANLETPLETWSITASNGMSTHHAAAIADRPSA